LITAACEAFTPPGPSAAWTGGVGGVGDAGGGTPSASKPGGHSIARTMHDVKNHRLSDRIRGNIPAGIGDFTVLM
jgi:hypothetical protein